MEDVIDVKEAGNAQKMDIVVSFSKLMFVMLCSS